MNTSSQVFIPFSILTKFVGLFMFAQQFQSSHYLRFFEGEVTADVFDYHSKHVFNE